ncbi:MAG: hypothetical protein RL712_845 [Bacteroidota bacterium]
MLARRQSILAMLLMLLSLMLLFQYGITFLVYFLAHLSMAPGTIYGGM